MSSVLKVGRYLEACLELASCAVKQGDSWVDWALGQLGVPVGHSHILSIEGKGQNSCVHVQEDSKGAIFFELFAVGGACCIGAMSELTETCIKTYLP